MKNFRLIKFLLGIAILISWFLLGKGIGGVDITYKNILAVEVGYLLFLFLPIVGIILITMNASIMKGFDKISIGFVAEIFAVMSGFIIFLNIIGSQIDVCHGICAVFGEDRFLLNTVLLIYLLLVVLVPIFLVVKKSKY